MAFGRKFAAMRRRFARSRARSRVRARTAVRAALVAGACAALAGLAVAGAWAYLAGSDAASNRFTPGSTTIEIVETFPDDPPAIEQGSTEKVVTVRNTGSAACFVRAIVEFSDSAAEGYASFAPNTAAWTERQADGYYYYRSALAVGQTTEALISSIEVGAAPPDGYRDFDVIVHAESAQATDPSTGEHYPDGPSAFAALESTA